jgi:hypothetical protein
MDRQQSLADWFSAPNSNTKLFAGNYSCGRMRKARPTRRMEPMGTERKAVRLVPQVVKVKAGCIAIRSEETEDFSFKQP